MKRNIIHSLVLLLIAGLAASCSKEVPEHGGGIRLEPKIGEGYTDTKTSIYSDSEFPKEDYFHVNAFLSDAGGAAKPFFDSDVSWLEVVNDQETIKEWRFFDPSDGNYKNYYFPIEGTVDFFAYVPQEYVKVDETTNPPTFSVEMPEFDSQTDDIKEFMYAYTPEKSKEEPQVPLEFEHPFAAIRFEVGQAHRDLTIRKMGFKGIYHTGKCTVREKDDRYIPEWILESSGDKTIYVDKIIPGDINFGGPIGYTYIVLPQTLEEMTFVIEYHWFDNDNDTSDDEHEVEMQMSRLHTEWEAGRIYTYSLDLGNSAEEILFNVDVEPWNHTYDYTFEIK